MSKKETKKVSRELAVSAPKREVMWGGAIPSVGVEEKNKEILRTFCNQVAKIYGVPSLGVNAMGGQPYLNKDGRLFLLNDLRKGKNRTKAIRKEFIERAKTPDEIAIVKTTLVFFDGHEVESIGEASKFNVKEKMTQVRNSLNMMAETRSLNRAIWQEIAGDVWNRVAENLEKARGLTPDQKAKVVEAGKVSYEEVEQPQKQQKPTTPEELKNVIIEAIKTSKKSAEVMDIDEKSQKSKNLTKAMKAEIHSLASVRVDELDLSNNGKK